MNEDMQYEPGYKPTPFIPINPYKKNSYLAYVPVKNGKLYFSIGPLDHSVYEKRIDKK